ncbi:hypothetical protein ANN_23329 [Periplaneta americana]|uniref:DUF4817 domain-containing protein n=1 Tax=Periplaneta americana TaxID=6978 RepID=A0ABQ8SMU0_PERAM|nr:hypothetical protein ANN_23329 [Periplaneta americana]
MAGLCEDGNESPGSLKAITDSLVLRMDNNRLVALGSVVGIALAFCARGCGFDPGPGRWHLSVLKCDRLMSADVLACKRTPAGQNFGTAAKLIKPLQLRASLNHSSGTSFPQSLPSKETLRGHSVSSFRGEGYIQCCVGVRLYDMYSNQELAEIHFMYGKADGNAALARRLYKERYPQRQCPDRKTFVRLHSRLCEYGKFNSTGLGRGRPRSTAPEVQEEILEAVNMTPPINTRRVALRVNVPHTTVWRLLKEYQLYRYHLQRVQALSPADYPARVRFCQWFLQQCGVNPNFPALVLFTDEAQFTRDGITNFHNQHVWAHENPRATVPSHHQVRFSLNMWAGIIGDRLVGPHVLVNRLTGQAYTNFLENTIPHVLEDTPLINRQHIHFLHDGAPAHFSRTARRYLDRRFPDRWIVPDLESLRNRIVACSEDIRNTPGVWDRVRRSMRHRCELAFFTRGQDTAFACNRRSGGYVASLYLVHDGVEFLTLYALYSSARQHSLICAKDECLQPMPQLCQPAEKLLFDPLLCIQIRNPSLRHVISENRQSLPSKETLRGHSDSSFRGEGYIQCCVGVRLCDMYSNQELAEIHFMYGKADGNAALARRLYQERYPQRQCPDYLWGH